MPAPATAIAERNSPLSERDIARFAERIAALVAKPGAIDRLCALIDELMAVTPTSK